MNDTVYNALSSTKKFVNKHKFAVGATVGLTAGLALNKWNMNQVDEFLKEHGLYEKYWEAEDAI